MLKRHKRKDKPVHLRSLLDVNDTQVVTYCGNNGTKIKSTFKRAYTTCPKCIDAYRKAHNK